MIRIEGVQPCCFGSRVRVRLTAREKQVVKLIAEGEGSKQIAYILGISDATVAVHRYNMMRKLGAHNIADVVRLGLPMVSVFAPARPALDIQGILAARANPGRP
jgi:DNA-binding CsgD family transcriptional regulator